MSREPSRNETVESALRDIAEFLEAAIRGQIVDVPAALRPRGARPVVALRDRKTGRKRRSDANFAGLDVTQSEIVIGFERDSEVANAHESEERLRPGDSERWDADTRIRDLINAVLAVEREGRAFISLLWFRENRLATLPWATDPRTRQQVIARAIEDGILEVRKIPNPKNPQYPVSTITLNRGHEMVRAMLVSGADEPRFEPCEIQGVPLSKTILESRR